MLLSFVSNYAIAQFFAFDVAWRWMLGLLAVPSAAFFALIFSVPESPRSLVKSGRSADAKKVLELLGEEDVDDELAAIQASLADRPGHVQERLFRQPYWRPVMLACTLAALSQVTGINAVLYYAPTIFGRPGRRAGLVPAAIHRRGRDASGVHDCRHVHHRPLRAADAHLDRIGGHGRCACSCLPPRSRTVPDVTEGWFSAR